jgi:hypothetical protein
MLMEEKLEQVLVELFPAQVAVDLPAQAKAVALVPGEVFPSILKDQLLQFQH